MKNGEVNTTSCSDCGKIISVGWLLGSKSGLASKGYNPTDIERWALCEHTMKPGYICTVEPFEEIQTTVTYESPTLTTKNIESTLKCCKCGYGVF